MCGNRATSSEVSTVDGNRYHLCSESCGSDLYDALSAEVCFTCELPDAECVCGDTVGGWPLRLSHGTLREFPYKAEVKPVSVKAGLL